MKTSDKIKLDMSKARERLAVLADKSDASDEEVKERDNLVADYADQEKRYQAAIISEDDEARKAAEEDPDAALDAESREFHENVAPKVTLGNFFKAAAEEKSLSGAEKEYNEALGISFEPKTVDGQRGIDIPLFMLAPDKLESEEAEYAATSLSLETVRNSDAWIQRVFLESASEALGVTRRMLRNGTYSVPVITGGVSPATTAAGTAKDEETFTAEAPNLEPRSIRAGYQVTTRDLYRLGNAYEMALRSDLRGALAEAMDREIINGVSSEITGFFTDTSISKKKLDGASDGAQATASTADQFVTAITSLIDGRYALETDNISLLVAPEVLRWLWAQVRALGTTDSVQLISFIRSQMGVMVRASDHIGAITGNQFYSIYCRARGKMGAAVHGVWDSATLIVDNVTAKTSGYVSIYVVGHHDFKIARHNNWAIRRVTTA